MPSYLFARYATTLTGSNFEQVIKNISSGPTPHSALPAAAVE